MKLKWSDALKPLPGNLMSALQCVIYLNRKELFCTRNVAKSHQQSFICVFWVNGLWSVKIGFENRCDCVSWGGKIKTEISLKQNDLKKGVTSINSSTFYLLIDMLNLPGYGQFPFLCLIRSLELFLQIQQTHTWSLLKTHFSFCLHHLWLYWSKRLSSCKL